jgi:osmotically-inducible protein OsmY
MAHSVVAQDSLIHKGVLAELRWDTHVDETDVGVEVDDGVVTLTGHVESYAKRVAAEDAAHRVLGVRDVANDVVVHIPGGFARTDTEIAHAVRRALEADVFVAEDNIETTVSNGWVTLKGEVDFWRERQDAERSILRLGGVRGVTNAITVRVRTVHPDTVRDTIEEALERRAEREAERIQVSVDEGVVTLSGRVRSWAEKRAVLGAVGHAPGVRSVVDRLGVAPYS